MAHSVGKHVIIDLYVPRFTPMLADPTRLKELLITAAERVKATILPGYNNNFHSFGAEQGVTGVIILMESHISVHTWPETGYMAIDIFTCGEKAEPDLIVPLLIETFKIEKMTIKTLARGE